MVAIRTGSAGLNVSDIRRSTAFYQRALNLEVIRASVDPDRPWVHLGQDGEVLLTLWQQSDESFARRRAGLHHLSFEVADLPGLAEVETALRAAGVVIRAGSAAPGGAAASGQIFFHDPDGIRLEVFARQGPPVDWTLPPACGFYDEQD
ncbi:VOC family protein [Micromonospora sp. NPDC049645]|uniref:VOC family protein n=1 Tax=Micromonospora sp. NPDC049645 TaxID=3155508 RepID=UPI00341F477E